ncbi:UNKNOWN [Stylonychia lemnae]|uniref:TLDc domain-containing protein n=1 Tax=Stylonychia lemnae TaxID=5949 RepID=A0A078ART0_STYLE|nr:UNKNOWN [Stylonychia lemnae]|eukprot:CDW83583.1 UNKNOWN [Stylonychia lemnae]
MDKTLLHSKHQTDVDINQFSQKRYLLHNAAAFSLGVALTYAMCSQTQPTCLDHKLDGLEDTQSLWLVEPKNKYLWNFTSPLQRLTWNQASHFTDISASPNGDLYGIQDYGVGSSLSRLGYFFNFVKGVWNQFDKDFQIKDIKFDKVGNYYLLDTQNQLYAKNSKTKVILKNIKDYEVTVTGQIYAISTNIKESNSQQQLNAWIQGEGFQYKLLSSAQFSKLGLKDEMPIYVDNNSTTVGYGYQCVKDLAVGVDGSVWALSCTKDSESQDFQLIKWDPFTLQWYDVMDTSGIKIAAYNEISISILDSSGRIRFSSEKDRYSDIDYYQRKSTTNLFNDSKILNETSLDFVQSLLVKQYSMSILCYRASRDGFASQNFHSGCDYKGPTLTIVKTTNGQVAGGYTSQSWKSVNNYVADKDAFLFSAEIEVQIPALGSNAIYDHVSYGPTFGSGHDFYVSSGSNANQNSYTNLGNAYKPAEGTLYQNNDARTYLLGQYSFITFEIEVYYLL